MHGLSDHRRLEERARIQTHNRGAVIHGIEVVVLRFVVYRMLAPERDVLEAGQIELLPLVRTRGVRPDQNTDVLQTRVAARPDRLDPALDKRGLARGVAEER